MRTNSNPTIPTTLYSVRRSLDPQGNETAERALVLTTDVIVGLRRIFMYRFANAALRVSSLCGGAISPLSSFLFQLPRNRDFVTE